MGKKAELRTKMSKSEVQKKHRERLNKLISHSVQRRKELEKKTDLIRRELKLWSKLARDYGTIKEKTTRKTTEKKE